MTKKKWSKMSIDKKVEVLLSLAFGQDKATEIAQKDGYPDEMMTYLSKYECPHCHSESFTAHQLCYHDVKVDGHGEFEQDNGIYESSNPYGPFTCTECDSEFEELPVAE
jgi:hypothetical protein